MNDKKNEQSDVDLALPWYTIDRLSAEERSRIESALNGDEDLRRHLALVRDEAAEAIAFNESLKTAPAAGFDRIMAKIDLYEAQHPRRVGALKRALDWIAASLAAVSPQVLAYGAVAAAVVICLQAGLLGGFLLNHHEEATYKSASADNNGADMGTYALISFVGTVSVQHLTSFLLAHHAVFADGPKPGGFYRIKIADQKLSGDALQQKLATLRTQTNIVQLLLPEPTKP
jgi:anti-sigma-K factor RskA